MKDKKLLTGLLAAIALTSCGKKTDANVENFTRGVRTYLEARGSLCLGKESWPIDVTERERRVGSRNAAQMPVLERLGIVSSSSATAQIKDEDQLVPVQVRRYRLTPAGSAYYRVREVRRAAPGGAPTEVRDFCAAKLSLDRVVRWDLVDSKTGPRQATVTYTYRVDAAPWTRDPEIQRVFPAVAGVIRGAGSARLQEGFTLTSEGWVANDLLETTGVRAPPAPEHVVSTP